jgi:hypothetical protein
MCGHQYSRGRVGHGSLQVLGMADVAASHGVLTNPQILAKLEPVPVFVVLNEDRNVVSMKSTAEAAETCYWHLLPSEAKAQLALAKAQSPDLPGLHVGMSNLSLAYALGAGWAAPSESAFQGAASTGAGRDAPSLRHQIITDGGHPELEGRVEMPIYLCEALQTPQVVPVFFDRIDLAMAWVQSGRTKESFNPTKDLTVMDLRQLVTHMQKEASFPWSLVQFVPPSRARAVMKSSQEAHEKRVADGDEPPPLEG